MPDPIELNDEDQKLVTLARSSRARNQTREGAAVRESSGRTYASSTVDLPSLKLSALQVAVAMAVSSGATALEAAAVVTAESAVTPADLAAVRDLGADAPIYRADLSGIVHRREGGTLQP